MPGPPYKVPDLPQAITAQTTDHSTTGVSPCLTWIRSFHFDHPGHSQARAIKMSFKDQLEVSNLECPFSVQKDAKIQYMKHMVSIAALENLESVASMILDNLSAVRQM